MRSKATFYHAGCPVCASAEQRFVSAIDPTKYEVEIVHLGEDGSRVEEAARAGVESVPAFLMDGEVFHVNFGASLDDLR